MTEAIVKINSIENQADDVFDMSIDSLFNNENDFKEVIKKEKYTKYWRLLLTNVKMPPMSLNRSLSSMPNIVDGLQNNCS